MSISIIERVVDKKERVLTSLTYINDAVTKSAVLILPGAVSVILENTMELNQILDKYVDTTISTLMKKHQNTVFHGLARLVRWVDHVSLAIEGREVTPKLSEQTIRASQNVIKSLVDGITELVGTAVEKIETMKTQSEKKTTFGVQMRRPSKVKELHFAENDKPILEQRHSYPEVPLTPREKDLIELSSSLQTTNGVEDTENEDIPPPKPPLPDHPILGCTYTASSNIQKIPLTPEQLANRIKIQSENAPKLPEKNRSSKLLPVECTPIEEMPLSSSFGNRNDFMRKSIQRLDSNEAVLSLKTSNCQLQTYSTSSSSDCSQDAVLTEDDGVLPPSMTSSVTTESSTEEGMVSGYRTKTLSTTLTSMQMSLSKERFTCRQTINADDMCKQVTSDSTSDANNQEQQYEDDSEDTYQEYGLHSNSKAILPKTKRHIETYMQMLGGHYSSMGIQDFGPMSGKNRHSLHAFNFYESKWQRYHVQLFQSFDNKGNACKAPHLVKHFSRSGRSSSMSSSGYGSTTFPCQTEGNNIQIIPEEKCLEDDVKAKNIVKMRDKGNNEIHNNDRDKPCDPEIIEFESIFPSPVILSLESANNLEDSDSEFTKNYVTDNETLDSIDVTKDLIMKGENLDEIKGGTVDALIAHATTVGKSGLIFQEVFLATYRTFITPRQLLKKLLHRHSRFSRVDDTLKRRLSRNAFSFIMRMMDEVCFRLELDNQMLKTLMDLVFQLLCNGELMQGRILRNKITEKNEQRKYYIENGVQYNLLANYFSNTKARPLLEFKSLEVAEQLTLLDAELFQRIDVSEALLWSREQSEERSPNLVKFTEHFNKISYWCRTRLLEQNDNREREKLFTKLLKIMKHLKKLNNFNSYLAILSAVDSAPIRRLEWNKQNIETLTHLCELIDSSASFRAYRQALAETQGLCIPYIGLVLQDLTFIHIGNPDFISDDIVNFSKRCQQFNILHNMQKFKKCNYEFKKNDKILACFNNFMDFLNEDALWEISEKLKPRKSKKLN